VFRDRGGKNPRRTEDKLFFSTGHLSSMRWAGDKHIKQVMGRWELQTVKWKI